MTLFSINRGIVVACDVPNLSNLKELAQATAPLPFIAGYKVGMELAINYGLPQVVHAIRDISNKTIIYDHQKFGTDIPDICGGSVLDAMSKAGIDAVIIFPLSGIETLKASVDGCRSRGLLPIVGGEMTHKGYLIAEGGYVANESPENMYHNAATIGVSHFVVPGTKLANIDKYHQLLAGTVSQPVFLMPGIGKGQGGDIVQAFLAVAPHRAFAIVGRGIYAEPDRQAAAKRLWVDVRARFSDSL